MEKKIEKSNAKRTDYLQDERPSEVDLLVQTPSVPDARHDVHHKIHRHQPQPRILDREVLVLRHILRSHLPLRIATRLLLQPPLNPLILPIERLPRDPTPEQHPAADREETQPDVDLGEEGVGGDEEGGDGGGDAVEDGVEDGVEEEEDGDVRVEEDAQGVLEVGVGRFGGGVEGSGGVVAAKDGDDGAVNGGAGDDAAVPDY